jgi:hypothetical protein
MCVVSLLLHGCGRDAGGVASAKNQAPILRLVADVPLPGSPSRFDYQSFDPTTGRLYIAHMGAGELLAFDTRTRQIVARAGEERS